MIVEFIKLTKLLICLLIKYVHNRHGQDNDTRPPPVMAKKEMNKTNY
jgi:hypothetical protein